MSICVFDPEMPTTPVEKTVYKQLNFQSSDDASSSTAPLTPQSPSAESREDQPQRGATWNKYNQNRRRMRNKPRNFGPRNTEMRPYHSPTHVSPPHDRPMTKNDIYFALDCEVRHIVHPSNRHVSIVMDISLIRLYFYYHRWLALDPKDSSPLWRV
jgi:hypothetical protein